MKKIFYLLLLSFPFFKAKAAVYSTPGTGVNWTLTDLVSNSGGIVTFDGTNYSFTDSVTISTNDVFRIETNETVLFNAQVVFKINGTIIINPPTGVLFSPVSTAAPFRGVWLELSAGSSIKKLTYEYASSFRLSDSSPLFENCIFRFNNSATTLSNGTLSLFRSSPTIINCSFLNNYRAAIQGGANIENAPKIYNSIFTGNNSSNQNVPHINLGGSGADTTKIIGCTITNPGGIRTGGIGFLPLATLHTLIENNHIANNRYGISLQGGSTINAMVRYNYIAFNNIENNPNLGGSGIAFAGGSSTSHQNSIVTGNTIEGNLWGVTILALSGGVPISGSMPNLGNINNSDTSDNGKNRFINNTNASTPGIDLYNNSIDPIFAMGNYWNTATEAEIEPKIFHQADNAAHGLVTYSNAILPVELLSFSGSRNGATATLLWATAQEINSHSFVLEKSFNGTSFSSVATVNASGNSNSTKNYSFTHLDANPFGGYIYYRLKSVDIDGRYSYSNVLAISFPTVQTKLIRHYPSLLQAGELMQLEIAANKNRSAKIQWIDAGGKIMATNKIMLQTGFNHFNVAVPSIAAKGLLLLKITTDDGFSKTIKVVLQ
ncbi:MAG TPA: hypothetical protein PK504_10125 [Ferruginibacter sp.]|nr:hypothetical protein [Ferruginibacter sp.]HRE63517.1 hypothetical protein [Ferruginibacter sp.]